MFNTGADTAKGRALRRDPRLSMLVDDERPPFAYVKLTGPWRSARTSTRSGGGRRGSAADTWAPDRAEEFGARNGVPGELLVRLRPTSVQAPAGIAD